MNIHSLLNVPGDPLWLPINYGEIFRAYWVSCRIAIMVYRGQGPEVFLESVPEGSSWIHYFLQQWSGYSASVDIGQCVWAFCREWQLECCWDLEKPKCPGKSFKNIVFNTLAFRDKKVIKHYTRKWNTSGKPYRLAISHNWALNIHNGQTTTDNQPNNNNNSV